MDPLFVLGPGGYCWAFSLSGMGLEMYGVCAFPGFFVSKPPSGAFCKAREVFFMSKILLSANHIVHYFGDRKILDFEKLTVYEGDHIGIVGTNGAGKTTLLNLLSGDLTPEEGSVVRTVPVCYFFRQFREQTEQPDPQSCRRLGLAGKLSHEQLSGGERTRLGLATLGKDSLLIFADEPTANLDADGVELCCQMLEQCPTLLLISHDRAVLDRLCTRVIEARDGQLHFYTGNFTAYREQREQAFQRQKFEYQQYRSERARLEQAARQRSQASKSIRKAPGRMGNSEARLHKRAAGKKWKSWTMPETRFYPAWNSWK